MTWPFPRVSRASGGISHHLSHHAPLGWRGMVARIIWAGHYATPRLSLCGDQMPQPCQQPPATRSAWIAPADAAPSLRHSPSQQPRSPVTTNAWCATDTPITETGAFARCPCPSQAGLPPRSWPASRLARAPCNGRQMPPRPANRWLGWGARTYSPAWDRPHSACPRDRRKSGATRREMRRPGL